MHIVPAAGIAQIPEQSQIEPANSSFIDDAFLLSLLAKIRGRNRLKVIH